MINRFGHSGGEWFFDGKEIIAMPSQIKVAGYVDGANQKEKAANARLLCAAPKLLDALDLLLSAEEDGNVTEIDRQTARRAIADAMPV